MTHKEALTLAIDVGQLEYKGNSVGYIYQKMQAYRLAIDNAWSALRAKNIHPDGKTSLADMIANHTTPPQRKPLTDEMVLAGARALAKRHADSCGLDFDDVWKYYAEEHKIDAKAVIEAAHGIK